MKKLFLLISVTYFFQVQLFAQNTFQRDFKGKTGISNGIITTVNNDEFLYIGIVNKQTTTFLFASLLDKNGNTIWAKYFTDSINNPARIAGVQTMDGGFIISASEYYNNKFSVLKLNANGKLLWSKIYSGFQNFTVYSITNAYNGNVTIAGSTSTQAFIMNITQGNGSLVWMKTLSANLTNVFDGAESFRSVVRTRDSGYIVGGIAANYGNDMLMVKYDKNGAYRWVKIISSASQNTSESITCVAETLDGGYVFSGNTRSPLTTGVEDISVVKTDYNGNIIWSKQFDNGTYETAMDLIKNPDSSFIIMSWKSLVRLSKTGAVQWLEKTTAGISPDYNFRSIDTTNDNGFIVSQENFSNNKDSALIIKFNSSGNTCNGVVISNPAAINMPYTQYAFIVDTADTKAQIQITNGTYKNVGGKTTNTILCQSAFAKNSTVALSQLNTTNSNKKLIVSVSPNPITNILNIEINYSTSGNAELSIINIEGKILFTQKIKLLQGTFNKTINLSSLPNGLYVLKLNDGNQQRTSKFIKN